MKAVNKVEINVNFKQHADDIAEGILLREKELRQIKVRRTVQVIVGLVLGITALVAYIVSEGNLHADTIFIAILLGAMTGCISALVVWVAVDTFTYEAIYCCNNFRNQIRCYDRVDELPLKLAEAYKSDVDKAEDKQDMAFKILLDIDQCLVKAVIENWAIIRRLREHKCLLDLDEGRRVVSMYDSDTRESEEFKVMVFNANSSNVDSDSLKLIMYDDNASVIDVFELKREGVSVDLVPAED